VGDRPTTTRRGEGLDRLEKGISSKKQKAPRPGGGRPATKSAYSNNKDKAAHDSRRKGRKLKMKKGITWGVKGAFKRSRGREGIQQATGMGKRLKLVARGGAPKEIRELAPGRPRGAVKKREDERGVSAGEGTHKSWEQ